MQIKKLKPIILLMVFLSLEAIAAPKALDSWHYIDLRDFTGRSFLQTMMASDGDDNKITKEDGIAQNFHDDYYNSIYDYPNLTQVWLAIENFDRKNSNRIRGLFNFNNNKMKDFFSSAKDSLKEFNPSELAGDICPLMYKMRLTDWSCFDDNGDPVDYHKDAETLAHFITIAAGGGTLVRIGPEDYYYNTGYQDWEVKSGRSYGATTERAANDASHLLYLGMLENFLSEKNDYRQFYQGIMEFLVNTDVSVYAEPSFTIEGQAVLTDYITVYTAEIRRHLMKKLHPNRAPWGNDMTEATFLSLYNIKSGMFMEKIGTQDNGWGIYELTDRDLGEINMTDPDGIRRTHTKGIRFHWAKSKISNRSGFGINRSARRKLQREITKFIRNHSDPEVSGTLERLEDLIGKRSDAYRGVMEFLNHNRNLFKPLENEEYRYAIADAFVDFLMTVYEKTDEITEHILNKQ
jgi:ribosomal protein S18